MIELEVLDPRHDPEPDYWRRLVADAGRRACWSYDLLRIAAWTSRYPVLLTVIRDAGRPAAVVSAVAAGPGALTGRGYAAAARTPRLGIPAVMLPGSSAERGWWFAGDPGTGRRRELLRHYARGVRRAAGLGHPGVMWLRAGAGDRESIPGTVRVTRPLNPLARLATPWSGLDGWYASLPRSRSADLRRQRRALRALDCRTGPVSELATAAEVAALLWRNEEKYRGGLFPSPPLALPYVEALLCQPGVIAIVYRDGTGRLLAAGLILDHPEWPLYWRWGALPVRHLYFDAYGRLLEWAIRTGKRGVILGKGKSELKTALGAELVPSYAIASGP